MAPAAARGTLVRRRSMIALSPEAVVFLAALVTALATGLGALPFALPGVDVRRWLGSANAVAAGVMLGASASLVLEGARDSGALTAVGAVAGALFVALAYRFVDSGHGHALRGLKGTGARS